MRLCRLGQKLSSSAVSREKYFYYWREVKLTEIKRKDFIAGVAAANWMPNVVNRIKLKIFINLREASRGQI